MQRERSKNARLLSALVAICAACPPPQAAEPEKPDAGVQQQPLERISASQLKRTKVVAASFPQLALDYGVEGFVSLQFTVLPDGSTADIQIVQAEPAGVFEANAIKALQQWRYEPGDQRWAARRTTGRHQDQVCAVGQRGQRAAGGL
ncbi:MAG: energy transducer TonB [Gammaproteobacteria bacterium]|nr:energy transducer TonB [Gammaproteobacteria bacterium]